MVDISEKIYDKIKIEVYEKNNLTIDRFDKESTRIYYLPNQKVLIKIFFWVKNSVYMFASMIDNEYMLYDNYLK